MAHVLAEWEPEQIDIGRTLVARGAAASDNSVVGIPLASRPSSCLRDGQNFVSPFAFRAYGSLTDLDSYERCEHYAVCEDCARVLEEQSVRFSATGQKLDDT